MRRYYVGLDVHSKDSVYAIQDELGALIGGTAAGTVLTLLFLPALYAIWFRLRLRKPEAQVIAVPSLATAH